MLERLDLENFRCFSNYKVDFEKFNIIVGRNNTGKSTIIDSLRLISNALRFSTYRRNHILLSRDIPFSIINVRHKFNEDDSIISAYFNDNRRIRITFPQNEIEQPYVEFFKNNNRIANNKRIRKIFKQSLGIVPPVGPFEESESIRDTEYLKRIMISHLTPRHFRNIWLQFDEDFEEFKELVERTWPSYSIYKPESMEFGDDIRMYYRDGGNVYEIYWAGHGFQVWLQLLTHLVKLGRKETIILDEPDVYLHPDLQKKLVDMCLERSNQVIIATHAIDIIDEVDPECIVTVDKEMKNSIRLTSVEELQKCIAQLGSTQNLKLAHFIRGNSCLFIEGRELKFLKRISNKYEIEDFNAEDFSVIPIGGFSNWERLKHINWIFENALGERIKCYLILDRDYHPQWEIDSIHHELEKQGVIVHVWKRKEIENYFINREAMYRMFENRFSERYPDREIPLKEIFYNILDTTIEELKGSCLSQIVGNLIKKPEDRSVDPSSITKKSYEEFEKHWRNWDYRLSIIPGKDFFGCLNNKLMNTYGISISIPFAIHMLEPNEIDTEIKEVIEEFLYMVNS